VGVRGVRLRMGLGNRNEGGRAWEIGIRDG